MSTRALYTPTILHTLHTRPGIDSHMSREGTLTVWTWSRDVTVVRSTPTHTTGNQSQYSVHDSLIKLLKTNCIISSSTVFQVRFWCRFCMWSSVRTHRHKTVHSWITNDCNLTRELCIPTWRLTKTLNIHGTSFIHFTLVLVSIHTCQGREHSRTKCRVETWDTRSTPTYTTTHQSQYSVHDSPLQLLETNCVSSPSLVLFLYVVMCPDTQTQNRPRLNHKRL